MGEVLVKTKLTNFVDEAMARRRKLSHSKVRSVEVDAIADTGVVTLALPAALVRKLGLTRTGKAWAEYANGDREEVSVVEGVIVEIMGRRALAQALVLGDQVLIGQTVLGRTDLKVDRRNRHNQQLIPAHPEGQVMMIR